VQLTHVTQVFPFLVRRVVQHYPQDGEPLEDRLYMESLDNLAPAIASLPGEDREHWEMVLMRLAIMGYRTKDVAEVIRTCEDGNHDDHLTALASLGKSPQFSVSSDPQSQEHALPVLTQMNASFLRALFWLYKQLDKPVTGFINTEAVRSACHYNLLDFVLPAVVAAAPSTEGAAAGESTADAASAGSVHAAVAAAPSTKGAAVAAQLSPAEALISAEFPQWKNLDLTDMWGLYLDRLERCLECMGLEYRLDELYRIHVQAIVVCFAEMTRTSGGHIRRGKAGEIC